MMKLTEQQIENLYKFTKKHYVEWYDLQSELVDHLANDIEQIWEKYPNLTFEEAKRKSFKKFGIFGFMDVVEQRQKALSKRYFKLFWKAFKSFFTIPKVVFTISLFFAILFFIRLVHHNRFVIMALILIVMLTPFWFIIKNGIEIKRKNKEKKRKYMFEDYISNLGGFASLFQIPFQILFNFSEDEIWSFYKEIYFTSTIVILSLTLYIVVYILPPKIRAIIAKEHPEYQII